MSHTAAQLNAAREQAEQDRDALLAENERLNEVLLDDDAWKEVASLREQERDAARALISWIDGACVDESPHMEIRAAIGRALHSDRGIGDYYDRMAAEERDAGD